MHTAVKGSGDAKAQTTYRPSLELVRFLVLVSNVMTPAKQPIQTRVRRADAAIAQHSSAGGAQTNGNGRGLIKRSAGKQNS